jgi:hypothetical protein
LRGSPAGTDASGTRHGSRLGARSEHQPTRPAAQLSVGLKNAAALSKAQKHRMTRRDDRQRGPSSSGRVTSTRRCAVRTQPAAGATRPSASRKVRVEPADGLGRSDDADSARGPWHSLMGRTSRRSTAQSAHADPRPTTRCVAPYGSRPAFVLARARKASADPVARTAPRLQLFESWLPRFRRCQPAPAHGARILPARALPPSSALAPSVRPWAQPSTSPFRVRLKPGFSRPEIAAGALVPMRGLASGERRGLLGLVSK